MKRYSMLLVILLTWLFFPVENQASELNFSVSPQTSKYQVDEKEHYFDLLLKPNQEELLTVQLTNDTDREVSLSVQVNNTTTNDNGVVEYGKTKIKTDDSLKYQLKDYVNAPKEVHLKPHSKMNYQLKVHMPDQSYSGVIAGGLTFSEKENNSSAQDSTNSNGLAIKNKYAYVVALLMRQTKENGEPNLHLTQARSNQVNARNVIQAHLQNSAPVYLNQLACRTTVIKKASHRTLYTNLQEDMQMAPNTHFNLTIPLNGDELQPGKYIIKVDAYGKKDPKGNYLLKNNKTKEETHYRYHWKLKKEFTIANNEAKKLNKTDVTIKKNFSWLYTLIGLFILLIVLFLFWLFIWKKRKNKK